VKLTQNPKALVIAQFVLLAFIMFWPDDKSGFGIADFLFEFIGVIFFFIGATYVFFALSSIYRNSLPRFEIKDLPSLKRALKVVWPEPAEEAKLITTGVFKRSRHPIYSGLLWLGYGIGLASGPWPHLFFAIALHVVLFYKANYEEALLLKKFKEYKKYMTVTGRFLPKGDE